MTVDNEINVNNDDRYCDYPLKLRRISGLPPDYLAREILPLHDIPHIEDPRRKRSLQKVVDLERDRASLPLMLLDKQPAVDDGSGVRLLDNDEYSRRLRRAVIPPARLRPVIRPMWIPNVRDPRRILALKRDGHSMWDMISVTIVENDLLPKEDETCPVLVVDLTNWPLEVSSEVEIWPHECNKERALLDAQFIDDSLMIEDNIDREDIFECDEDGQPVRHYHADVDTPMLGDDDDEILVDGVFDPNQLPRERKFSDSDDPVVHVKEEQVLRRPMPTEYEEDVDLVDLCSDNELDVKPKIEPVFEGYREDVVREILEVVTLDDDNDDDDIEIESVRATHRSNKPEDNSARRRGNNRLMQSEILIGQPRLKAKSTDSNRNSTPVSRTRGGGAIVDAASVIQAAPRTECASGSAVRSPSSRNPREIAVAASSERTNRCSARELVPAYVCDYEHRSVGEQSTRRRSSSPDTDDAEKRKSATDRVTREETPSDCLSELSAPPASKNGTECITAVLDASFLRGVCVRFDENADESATLRERWSERTPEAAVWTGCEKVRKERRTLEVARRWRPYEGRMGKPPAKRQLEYERAVALLRKCFSLNWSSISIFIKSHNLTLQCLLQTHVSAARSVNFWRARNDHWRNKNHCSNKGIPQIENYGSSSDNDQGDLSSYDADEETNDYEELISQENQHKEFYFPNTLLTTNRIESNTKNFNSQSSSSLQVYKNNAKLFKKRHSLSSVVKEQYKCAKRSRSYSDDSVKKVSTRAPLKLKLKKTHPNREDWEPVNQSNQLIETENISKIVEVNSSEDSSSSHFSNRFTSSENNILLTKNTNSTEGTYKLKVDINKIVPELKLDDIRPLNVLIDRNHLENSLCLNLKSKLKRNMNDAAEVESKRQKVIDSLLEHSLQKKQPLESKSSNGNSKVFLPKTNIYSSSEFSSCNKSNDKNSILKNSNLKQNTPKNNYLRKVVPEKTVSVNSSQKIQQVDYNYNIKKIPETDNNSLENSKKDEINVSKGIRFKIKDHPILFQSGSLKAVFKSLFGEVSDTSETEDEIIKKKRRKSRENRKSQSETSNVAQSFEINHQLKLKNLNERSLKSTIIENDKEINRNKTESSNTVLLDTNKCTEIFSVDADTNVESVILSKNIKAISIIQNDKENDSNEISSDKDNSITNQDDELQRSNSIEESNSSITNDSEKHIDEHENSSEYKSKNNLEKEDDKLEKSPISKESNSNSIPIDSEESNSSIKDNFLSKDRMIPDCLQASDQIDLEGGDFEFISSINKNRIVNEYSDDDYNDDIDFDTEYNHENIEYSSDIELIEYHKNPSNKDLKNVMDEKSPIPKQLTFMKEISKVDDNTHNLNKLPSFYNDDVTNYVNKDVIMEDKEICILDESGSVSKIESKKNNFKEGMTVKPETIINLDSDEDDIDIIEEITIEESIDKLNKEFFDSKESIINNSINFNNEGGSKICETTELNDISLEINNKTENLELNEMNLSASESGLESTNRTSQSPRTLMDYTENETATNISLEINKKTVSSDAEVENTSQNILDSSQETTLSNTFINNLINDRLKSFSDPNEISTSLNTLENILNSEESHNASIPDGLEEILEDLNRRSASPYDLVIDETAGGDDDESNSTKCKQSDSDNKVTSTVNELESKSTLRFTGNLNYDLNNPNILKEFNLAKEITAPEEVKCTFVDSIENINTEQEICANLLKEIQIHNTCNLQVENPLEIPVSEVSEVLNNQAVSNNIPSSSIVIEISAENQENKGGYNLLEDINVNLVNEVDTLNKNDLKTTGIFKCRDINELLENPVNKQIETNDLETSNLNVQTAIPSEIPSSPTTNYSNFTTNTTQVPNNISISQISQPNNLINADNLIQTNASILSKPINEATIVNQLPTIATSISQQVQQPILNAINFTSTPQHTSQMINLKTAQYNPNSSQGNMQNVNSTSVNAPNQVMTECMYASSIYSNMFPQKNIFISNLKRLVSTLNIPTVVPSEPYTIFQLPFAPKRDLILPGQFSISSLDSQISVYNKVNNWRKMVLEKIETEINSLRAIPEINLYIYIDALINKKTLTEDVWNFQLKIFTVMKCLHAIANTTSNKDLIGLCFTISYSLKHCDIPQMKDAITMLDIYKFNNSLKDCGYIFKNTKECINPFPVKLQENEDLSQLGQTSKRMSVKERNLFFKQVRDYNKIYSIHGEQLKSANINFNVENQIINQNNSVTIRPVSVASINHSNSSTNYKSLQKSSLNDTKKKQSILKTSNVPIQKNVDKRQKKSAEISIAPVVSEKRDANTKSILDNLNPTCLKCEKPSEIVCSNCLSVGYCSRECQHNHWKEIHHKTCEKHKEI